MRVPIIEMHGAGAAPFMRSQKATSHNLYYS
jgi:hypothetical protein